MKAWPPTALLLVAAPLLLAASSPAQDADDPREVWNRVFQRAKERGMEWEANAFLAERVAGRLPGRALDIGMGQGRNALFLAELGWRVTGFDISDEAVAQAREAAAAAGLELDAEVVGIEDFDYGVERWDLVVVMYMHRLVVPRAEEIVASLAPGGLLVVEGFHRDLNRESVQGGYLGYATNELLEAFDGLRVLHYEDRTAPADWGRSMAGAKPIVRMVARKPLPTLEGLRGPYMGQELPGATPARFAPGIVDTDGIELNGVVHPHGRELLFTRLLDGVFTMHRSVVEDGGWSVPRPLVLYHDLDRSGAVDMTCTADGERLYWLGLTPGEGGAQDLDIWTSARMSGDWSTAARVPAPVSTSARESYPCVVADGSLYFSSDRAGSLGAFDVWRAQRLADGGFAEPVNLGAPVNSEHHEGDTFVAPDESYLIVSSSRPGGLGENDLYASFRQVDGSWSAPVSLGDEVNSEHTDFCPMVTPDGEQLFFSRRVSAPGAGWDGVRAGDVYWVDAAILEALRR